MFNIVLLEPEIPQNTGNIGRTCVAGGCSLHLIEPMKFQINEKQVRRAGLDYWDKLRLTVHDSYKEFMEYYYRGDYTGENYHGETKDRKCGGETGKRPRIFLATTKAEKTYADVEYKRGDYIMFGKESAGIPEEILVKYPEDCIRIPMVGEERSLNLSNSVAIILYEALRQNGFEGMNAKGSLHKLQW